MDCSPHVWHTYILEYIDCRMHNLHNVSKPITYRDCTPKYVVRFGSKNIHHNNNTYLKNIGLKLTFKYVWPNHLLKNNKGCAHVKTTNTKWQLQKQQHNNHNYEWLYSMFANHHVCVVLWSRIHDIGSWNCPKIMHKSKYAQILVCVLKIYSFKRKINLHIQHLLLFLEIKRCDYELWKWMWPQFGFAIHLILTACWIS